MIQDVDPLPPPCDGNYLITTTSGNHQTDHQSFALQIGKQPVGQTVSSNVWKQNPEKEPGASQDK